MPAGTQRRYFDVLHLNTGSIGDIFRNLLFEGLFIPYGFEINVECECEGHSALPFLFFFGQFGL